MLWNQWWFWLFVVILASLSIPILGVLGWAITNTARALRGNPKELRQIKDELNELRTQLGEARAAQKLLEVQRHLSQQELKRIEQQTPPQGVAVILFSDITGFTSYFDEHGDEAAYDLLQQHHRIVRSCVQRYGGVEVKQLGDGFMLSFSSAKQALLCATEVQSQLEKTRELSDSPLRVRIGLHAGEPIHEERDFIGQTVNLAERIMKQAQGGQIFVSEIVKNLAGPLKGFQYVDQGKRRLEGISEPQQLYQFQPIAALAYPLDSTVSQELEAIEKRLKEET
jgi:class 3 adenylate cyclase